MSSSPDPTPHLPQRETGSPSHRAAESAPTPSAPAQPAQRRQAGLTSSGKVRSTYLSAWWMGIVIAAIVLVLLLIFILQNSAKVTVHYLWFDGRVSLAVALLLSAVAGVLLVAIPGGARILQLRRALKKNAAGISTGRRRAPGKAA
jgi:uncharacterized integral membrane protein